MGETGAKLRQIFVVISQKRAKMSRNDLAPLTFADILCILFTEVIKSCQIHVQAVCTSGSILK